MANKRKYDKMLAEILIPNGFYRRGANFLRLHGDGVLQSIFLHTRALTAGSQNTVMQTF